MYIACGWPGDAARSASMFARVGTAMATREDREDGMASTSVDGWQRWW